MSEYGIDLRRKRLTPALREIFATVDIRPRQLIQPYFIYEGLEKSTELTSITGQKKHTTDSVIKEIEFGLKNGVCTALLFFIPQNKKASNFSYDYDASVLSEIKERFGKDLNLFTDMCMCSQTVSGHCGFLGRNGLVENEATVNELVRKSVIYAQAGADAICPSDMMDNRIAAIRRGLDGSKLQQTMIMSYSSKFSSNLYGPFRDAAESSPGSGDRKSYQIDYRNEQDAILSSLRDAEQGADILMVKPAGNYLDIISKIKNHSQLNNYPLAAYQVSGEYQALQIMSEQGLMDFEAGYLESLYAIKRSGADLIITYGANNFKSIIEGR